MERDEKRMDHTEIPVACNEEGITGIRTDSLQENLQNIQMQQNIVYGIVSNSADDHDYEVIQ